MAEDPKQQRGAEFDPDATVTQPAKALDSAFDPDATVAQAARAFDPEATLGGPAQKLDDPESTDRRPAFDPDATVNPTERLQLDPEATIRIPSPGRTRKNPFAPKAPPETIQANLGSLGGLNSLVALANPILGAVPQIRRTLRHPDPAALRQELRDQIESLEMSALSADIPEEVIKSATYALCALLDESAAATPWGGVWAEQGLLRDLRGEGGAGEGFFKLLDQVSANPGNNPEASADLLEFLYICLALGFEGKHREVPGGRQALAQVRNGLYATIALRRARPVEGLSPHWRSATAEAAAAPALQIAAKVSAQVHAAEQSAPAAVATASPSMLARIPRRAVWGGLAGIVGASVAFYMLALRLLDDKTDAAWNAKAPARTRTAEAPKAPATPVAAPAPAAAVAASAELAKSLQGAPVTVTEQGGRTLITLRNERQFGSGAVVPAPELRPVLERVAAALDKLPGSIQVVGHADGSPTRSRSPFASNTELSAARAQAAAKVMAPKLGDAGRLAAEGKGDAEPLAPNDSAENRARNRRIVIVHQP